MKRLILALSVGLLSVCGIALADMEGDDGMQPKLSFAASDSSTITATVEALDYDTREATLLGPEGNTVSFVVGDAVQRLDEISVGDEVTVEYDELFTVDLYANNDAEPDAAELSMLARTAEGEAPGGAVVNTTVITAVVQAIDLDNDTATLRLVDGSLRQIEADDPDNLAQASVGDLVVMTATESVAISVASPAGD